MTPQQLKELLDKYLAGEANPSEEGRLLEWYDSFSHLPDRLRTEGYLSEKEQKVIFDSLLAKKTFFSRYKTLAAAACLVPILGLAYWLAKPAKASPQTVFALEEQQRLSLSDGSGIWLKKDSRARFDEKQRELSLTGSAFFDVHHDPEKPFVVHTSRADIQVLGTSFEVKTDGQTEEITLLDGSVRVTAASSKGQYLLRPHQKLRLTHNPDSVSLGAASFSFTDLRFDLLAITMERWFRVKLVLENPAVRGYRFTGVLDDTDLTTVLHALQLSQPFNYRQDRDTIVLY